MLNTVELQGLSQSQENNPPEDPTVALHLGTFGDPRGVGVSYERGTPEGRAHCGPRPLGPLVSLISHYRRTSEIVL